MEIVIRAAVVFVFLWGITRVVGRSTLGELSTFELLLYVVMGDLVQQSVTQQDYSITTAVLAIGTFALFTVLLTWVQWRFPRMRPLVQGTPLVVVRDGRLIEKSTRQNRLSIDDLRASARQQGIKSLEDVELAVLEADGKISFFTRDSGGDDGSTEPPEVG